MWTDLNMSQKAQVMAMAAKAGMTELDRIKDFYNHSLAGDKTLFTPGGKVNKRDRSKIGPYRGPKDKYIDVMLSPYEALLAAGIPFYTSNPWLRAANSKWGVRNSWHKQRWYADTSKPAYSRAVDMTPRGGNYEAMVDAMRKHPGLIYWAAVNNYGLIDERGKTPWPKSGPHMHFGPIKNWDYALVYRGFDPYNNAVYYTPAQDLKWEDYQQKQNQVVAQTPNVDKYNQMLIQQQREEANYRQALAWQEAIQQEQNRRNQIEFINNLFGGNPYADIFTVQQDYNTPEYSVNISAFGGELENSIARGHGLIMK